MNPDPRIVDGRDVSGRSTTLEFRVVEWELRGGARYDAATEYDAVDMTVHELLRWAESPREYERSVTELWSLESAPDGAGGVTRNQILIGVISWENGRPRHVTDPVEARSLLG